MKGGKSFTKIMVGKFRRMVWRSEWVSRWQNSFREALFQKKENKKVIFLWYFIKPRIKKLQEPMGNEIEDD